MPEKLTLAVYLERRGAVKTLTKIEAEAFGVPYPLVKGWPYKYGAVEITQAMLEHLQEKIGRAKPSTAEKAQRGLNGVEGVSSAPGAAPWIKAQIQNAVTGQVDRLSLFPGFALRLNRRFTSRRFVTREK